VLFRSDRPDSVVVQAEALHAAGDPEGARRLAGTVAESAYAPVPTVVNAWLTLATVAADGGDIHEATDMLRRAFRVAEPESLRRSFHEVGSRLRRLMRDAPDLAAERRALGGTARPHQLQRGQGTTDVSVEPVIVERLSKRELEVLRHVEAMLPTEEIAGVMYVSVNTVKTHVRSILRKLSASRRTEAVRRARELGLI